MLIDALVLAGGRSSRLGGTPKHQLIFGGRTLLQLAIAAAAVEGRTVVVGALSEDEFRTSDVLVTREDPPFGGPAAAIGAGMRALAARGGTGEATLVLGCDMPGVSPAVAALIDAASAAPVASGVSPRVDGYIAVDDEGHRQGLVALYLSGPLRRALGDAGSSRGLDGLSVRSVTASLNLVPVTVPAGSTKDVDTWADAALFGIAAPAPAPERAEAHEPGTVHSHVPARRPGTEEPL